MPFAPRARVRRFDARKHPHQRRLAGAVRSDQRDAIAALDQQVQLREDHLLAVRFAHVVQLEHRAPALRAHGKGEMDALALGRRLDRHDFLEHLDAALHLRRLRRLIAEAIDEHLHARDLLVLLALRLAQLVHARVALDDVMRVVAGVIGQLAQVEIGDARDDGVEKEAIVRHEDDCVRVRREIFLEPVARLEVEMVGRLVEQQQRRPAEQQLREREPHLPSARQRIGRLLERLVGEPETAQHRRDLQVDVVPSSMRKRSCSAL